MAKDYFADEIGKSKVRKDYFSEEINPNVKAATPEKLKSIFPEIPQDQKEKHPYLSAVAKTGQDALTIPAHFFNQLALNYPRYLTEKAGYKYPEGTDSPVAGVTAKVAGVIGGAKNPIFRAFGIGPGSSLGAQALAGGITGTAYAQPMEDRLKTGAIGALVPAALKGATAAIAKTPKALEVSASRTINSLIKPLLRDFSYGKNPGLGVAKAKIIANSWDDLIPKIESEQADIGKKIGTKVSDPRITKRIDITPALKPIDDAIKEASVQNNQAVVKRLTETKLAITDVLTNQDGVIKSIGKRKLNDLAPKHAVEIKRGIGEMTKWTGNPSDDKTVNKALKMTYGKIKDMVNDAVPGVAELNEQYANIISAKIAAVYRDKILQRQNLVGLSPKLLGGGSILFGGVSGNPDAILAGIAAIGVDKILGSAAFKTRLAATLSKLSEVDRSRVVQQFPKLSDFVSNTMKQPYSSKRSKNSTFSQKDIPTLKEGKVLIDGKPSKKTITQEAVAFGEKYIGDKRARAMLVNERKIIDAKFAKAIKKKDAVQLQTDLSMRKQFINEAIRAIDGELTSKGIADTMARYLVK